jgi:hypothetical protein
MSWQCGFSSADFLPGDFCRKTKKKVPAGRRRYEIPLSTARFLI